MRLAWSTKLRNAVTKPRCAATDERPHCLVTTLSAMAAKAAPLPSGLAPPGLPGAPRRGAPPVSDVAFFERSPL